MHESSQKKTVLIKILRTFATHLLCFLLALSFKSPFLRVILQRKTVTLLPDMLIPRETKGKDSVSLPVLEVRIFRNLNPLSRLNHAASVSNNTFLEQLAPFLIFLKWWCGGVVAFSSLARIFREGSTFNFPRALFFFFF